MPKKKSYKKKSQRRCYQPLCDGDCLHCRYSDCLVPAVDEAVVKLMTKGGVKGGYLLPRNSKNSMAWIESK